MTSSHFSQTYSDCPLEFGLEFWDTDTLSWASWVSAAASSATYPFVEEFNDSGTSTTYSDYGVTNPAGLLKLGASGLQALDDDAWYNITAKLTVESSYSV